MNRTLEGDELRDRRLARAAREGDLDAFSALVSPYRRPFFNAAYRIIHHPQDSEDVTQIALLRVYEKLDRYDSGRPFFRWAFKIVVREALRWVERESQRSRPLDEGSASASEETPSSWSSVAAHLQLEKALSLLGTDQRTVIVLRHLHGFSYAEIAEILDVAEKTVRSRLFEARKKLRSLLAESE